MRRKGRTMSDEDHRSNGSAGASNGSGPSLDRIGGLSGALVGAGIGSAAGPVGSIIGGIAGAIGGWWAGHAVIEAAHSLNPRGRSPFSRALRFARRTSGRRRVRRRARGVLSRPDREPQPGFRVPGVRRHGVRPPARMGVAALDNGAVGKRTRPCRDRLYARPEETRQPRAPVACGMGSTARRPPSECALMRVSETRRARRKSVSPAPGRSSEMLSRPREA